MGIDINNIINNYENKNVTIKDKLIKQNEVWMVALGEDNIIGHEQKGNRPFYVISDTDYNKVSQTPVGFFTSTSEKKKTSKFVCEIIVNDERHYVNISQIRTLCTSRFKRHMYNGTNVDLKNILDRYNKEIINGGKK